MMSQYGPVASGDYDLSNFFNGAGEDIYDLLHPFNEWWNSHALPKGYHLSTYPGVPKRKARIRLSISASHTRDQLDHAVDIITSVLREEGILL